MKGQESRTECDMWIRIFALGLSSMLVISISLMTLSDWGILIGIIIGGLTCLTAIVAAIRWLVGFYFDYCYPWRMTLKYGNDRAHGWKLTIKLVPSFEPILVQVHPHNAIEFKMIKIRMCHLRTPPEFVVEMYKRYRTGTLIWSLSNILEAIPQLFWPRRVGCIGAVRIASMEDVTANHPQDRKPNERWEVRGHQGYLMYDQGYQIPNTTPIRIRLHVRAAKPWKGQIEFSSDVKGRKRPIRRSIEFKISKRPT